MSEPDQPQEPAAHAHEPEPRDPWWPTDATVRPYVQPSERTMRNVINQTRKIT